LADEDIHSHITRLNQAFKASQLSPYCVAVITDGGVKKSNVASAVTHTWADNTVTDQHHIQTMNITPTEAEIMAMRIGLIPAMDIANVCSITVITDALPAARKILESQPNPLQKAILPLVEKMRAFLSQDSQNSIQFWQCPKKVEWPQHKLVDNQVKASKDEPILPSKNSHLFSKKKKYDSALKEWQDNFVTSKKRGQLFLDFEDKKQVVIKPTYAKGGSWLPSIGFTNALCAQFTRMATGHAPIGEYQQRFFPNSSLRCPCGTADIQTQEHIVMQCLRHNPHTRLVNIVINSFVHFLIDNPSTFSFDNR